MPHPPTPFPPPGSTTRPSSPKTTSQRAGPLSPQQAAPRSQSASGSPPCCPRTQSRLEKSADRRTRAAKRVACRMGGSCRRRWWRLGSGGARPRGKGGADGGKGRGGGGGGWWWGEWRRFGLRLWRGRGGGLGGGRGEGVRLVCLGGG